MKMLKHLTMQVINAPDDVMIHSECLYVHTEHTNMQGTVFTCAYKGHADTDIKSYAYYIEDICACIKSTLSCVMV